VPKLKKNPLAISQRFVEKDGDGVKNAGPVVDATSTGARGSHDTTSDGAGGSGRPHVWISALTVLRWVCVVGFSLAALASFSAYGSRVYRGGGAYEPMVSALVIAALLAAAAAWWRFKSDRASQSFLVFFAFAGLALLYGPHTLFETGGEESAGLVFGALSRTVFAAALIASVAAPKLPHVHRVSPSASAALAIVVLLGVNAAIHSDQAADFYRTAPRSLILRAEAVSLTVSLFGLLWAVRVWWRTRRPFLIYIIGSISALTLASALFLSSAPWEGRWWVAHLGLFASTIILGEGVVAESSRRGRLSEVMDLGGLSKLAEGTVDAMRDGLALHDANGALVGWNPAAERITGWPRETALQRLSPGLPDGAIELGEGSWVDVRHFTVHQNGYQYQATLFTDVTERKRSEEALRESEERYRSLVEVSPDAVMLMDLEGKVGLCNRRAAALHGYESGEELLGRNFFDLVAEDDRERAMANAIRIVREGGVRDVEYRMVRRDRSSFSAELSASVIRDVSGAPQMMTAVIRDITERKRSAQALLESEERYRGLVQASPDAVALTDFSGKILLCNQQAASLHGFASVDDMLGLNIFDLVAPEDRGSAIALSQRTIVSGAVSHEEYDLLRRDDSRFPGEISASAISDADGAPVGMTAVWRDISERRRAEDELRRTTALVDLLRSVAVAANEATSLDNVLRFTLSHVCTHVGWPTGHAYILAGDAAGELTSSRIWYTAAQIQIFREISEQMRFGPGVGLPGRVLASGRPAWVHDLRDACFARGEAAQKAGIKGAFAFPVLAGEEVVAVLEFFSDAFEEPDEPLLEVMAGIGTTLGRVVERKRARDEIDRVFTLSQDMLAIVGFNGEFRRVNHSFTRALSYTEQELLKIPYLNLVHAEDLRATYNELQRLATGAPVKGFELRMRRKDGSYIWTQWNATPFPSDKAIYTHARNITERKRSEEAIQAASDEIRDLYNAAPCGYHSLDQNGTFVRINDTELEWLGYKRNEVIGKKKITDVMTPGSRRTFKESLPAFYRRGWMRGVEVEMVRKNGTTFPALVSSSAVKDSSGGFVMTRSTVFDITERKRAEEELRESELRARTIVNTAYDAFVAIDQSGIITDWNPQAEATFGWTRKDAIGRKLSETIIPRRFRRAHGQGLAQFLRSGKGPVLNRRIELAAVHKDGHEFQVETTISPVQVGDEYTFNAFIHDITERKQAEKTRGRLAAIVESSDDAIIGTKLDGKITSWNKGAVHLYGYSSEEAIDKPLTMLVPRDRRDEVAAIVERERAGERVEHFETVCVRRDGSRVDVSLTISPILDADGTITGASTIARDVTARKRAEALARQTEELARSNADLEQFAYVASHDLQEPLRMVTGYCDLLQRRYKGRLDSDADDFITFAVEGARRMQELVRGLLAYSRVGPQGETLELVDSTTAFERAVANLGLALKESGGKVAHGRLPTLRADSTQLEHVFQNLIGNAIKFRGDEPPRVNVRAVRKSDTWLFSVRDNGIGIDHGYEEKVFAIFQRLHGHGKYPGTGLGLAICKKIIERHGGNIWFESEPGRGTTFYFTLPAETRE
jgi:PAS domain S-box-containing protein